KPEVTATYSDGSSHSQRPEVTLTIVDVKFNPSSTVVPSGSNVHINVAVTPSAEAGSLTFTVAAADGSGSTPIQIVSQNSISSGVRLTVTADSSPGVISSTDIFPNPPLTDILAQLNGRPPPLVALMAANDKKGEVSPFVLEIRNKNAK